MSRLAHVLNPASERPLVARFGAIGAVVLAYVVVFFPISRLFGPEVGALAVIPAAAAAWLCGIRATYATLIVAPALNLALFAAVGMSVKDLFAHYHLIPGAAAAILTSVLIGLLSDLYRKLQRQNRERERAIEELRGQDARYRALVRHSWDAVIVVGPDKAIRYASPSLQQLLGYKRARGLRRFSTRIVHPADRARAEETFARATADPDYHDPLELRLRHADGSWRDVEVVSSNGLDDPHVGGLVLNLRDITERKVVERALRESERSYRLLTEQAADAILLIDAAFTQCVEANARACAMFGLTQEEFSRAPITQAFEHGPEPLRIAELRRGATLLTERRVRRKDGTPIWIEAHTQRLADGRFQVIARDITARKAAEEERQALLRALHERVKELTALHQAAHLFQQTLPIAEVLRALAALLTSAWQHSEIAAARASFGALVGETPGFAATPWRLAAPFATAAGEAGCLEVIYREAPPTIAADPFLPEERELLSTLADMLRTHIERQQAEMALRDSQANLATAQRIAHLGSWEYDFAHDALHWSDEVFRIGGLPPQSFTPTPERLIAVVHPEDRELVLRTQRASIVGDMPYDIDHRIVRPDGEVRVVNQQAELIRDAQGQPTKRVGIVHDITERKRLQSQLQHLALHDPLTALPNRALFLDRLERATGTVRRDGTTCAVCFLDLDRFKDINDSLGHATGDALLIAAAGRLHRELREADTLARLGGDEFAILLEALPQQHEATAIAERLLRALADPIVVAGQELRVTASIGIVVVQPGADPATLLRDADVALYRAKAQGRARYEVFDPSMAAALRERLTLERDLRRAIERDELNLVFQPQIRLADGRIERVEALVRWHHPERGVIAPGQFIPIAEETGLIREIDRWVLATACRQAQSWRQASPLGHELLVAVNISARQFQDPDLVAVVSDALVATALPADRLELEITETILMSDAVAALAVLSQLQALGVRLAIDDFGTGYSSLAYLKRFPVDTLKIDRAFVDGLGTEPEDTAIVGAMLNLAHTLGLEVIAEGVETATQAAQLRALGCGLAQGYYFARPLQPEAIGALLDSGLTVDVPPPLALPGGPTPLAMRARASGHHASGLAARAEAALPDRRGGR